jgi:hypothetical protein
MTGYVRWAQEGWRGWIAPAVADDAPVWLAAAASGAGRTSRHARTLRVAGSTGAAWVKSYPPPDGRRARRAFALGRALAAAGFGVPPALLVATRGGAGLLVTREVGGEDLLAATAHAAPGERRRLLRALGAEVGRLHAAGFVHGDLVPANIRVHEGRFVFLDHDRTRRSRLLVRLVARRNLVQLGRFVVPGVTLAGRARVLDAYARTRGLGRRARRRLAAWVIAKTIARRCAIDAIAPAEAARAGFAALMRPGGPFDPAVRGAA